MPDDKKKGSGGSGDITTTAHDGGNAELRVREQEGEAPEAPNYPDPTKGSSTKPGTRALAREAVFKAAQQTEAERAEAEESQAKQMGMSKARQEAYAEFEAAGNK